MNNSMAYIRYCRAVRDIAEEIVFGTSLARVFPPQGQIRSQYSRGYNIILVSRWRGKRAPLTYSLRAMYEVFTYLFIYLFFIYLFITYLYVFTGIYLFI